MLSKYGFREVRKGSCLTEDGLGEIYFYVSDDPSFPADIRAKTEELIDEGLRIFKARYCEMPVCENMILDPAIRICFKNNIPFYYIQFDMYDDYDKVVSTEYIIDIDEPLYRSFKSYILQQFEMKLFR